MRFKDLYIRASLRTCLPGFCFILTQCFRGAGLRAFIAEDTLRSVLSSAGLLTDLNIHGTNLQTFPAVDTFALIAVDAQQGKIAHGLEKYRNRTQIFAERTVIPEDKGQRNARDIVKCVPHKEHPEHDLLQMSAPHQKQPGNQCQR